MKHYAHFSELEREIISQQLKQDATIRCIAETLGRNASSVSREIQRNAAGYFCHAPLYFGYLAQRKARKREKQPRRQRVVHPGTPLWEVICAKLRLRWSPDQIAVYLKQTYAGEASMQISHEAIYQAIYVLPRGTLRSELIGCLRRSHRHRRRRRYLRNDRRGSIPDLVSIHERPEEVESRGIPGHWEGDLVVGKHHTSAIGTLVERTSRKVLLCKLRGRTSATVLRAFERRLHALPQSLRATLTYDRGSEMSRHRTFTKRTKMKVFFCDPQSPWQRGTNENTNSLVRDFFPKGTDFSRVPEQELLHVEKLLNERPRKCLQYRTPDEVFSSHLSVALGG